MPRGTPRPADPGRMTMPQARQLAARMTLALPGYGVTVASVAQGVACVELSRLRPWRKWRVRNETEWEAVRDEIAGGRGRRPYR